MDEEISVEYLEVQNTPEDPEDPDMEQDSENTISALWKSNRLLIIMAALLLVAAIAAATLIGYIYFVISPFAEFDKIMPNVYCAGVDISGMTRDEARDAVEQALRDTSYSVKLILPDHEYTFKPRQEGVVLNVASIVEKAYTYGRANPTAYGIYSAYQAAKRTEYRLSAETVLEYSQEDVQQQALEIGTETYLAPTDSTISCDTGARTVSLSLGQPGHIVMANNIYLAVCNAFDTMDFADIVMDYDKIEIDMDALAALCHTATYDYHIFPENPVATANEETHTIELSMGLPGWKLDGTALYDLAAASVAEEKYGEITIDMEQVETLTVDILDAYNDLACDPTEPYYYNGTVYEGKNGYTLDWDSAVNQIKSASYGETITIPMTAVAPEHTAEEFRAKLFRDRLSSYSTAHTANSNRTNNLTLACKAINGTVINDGEVFSFNSVVGQRTAEKGYKTATVYVGSESAEELGGGICQVASTIYNAALYAELEITSRACHTFFVTYVPGGLDATVYWGSVDFCFRNNTGYPIRINASVSNGNVNISIDGTKTTDHVVKLSSSRLSSTPYTTKYVRSSAYKKGTQKVTTSPYTGYTYEAYQYIYDGNGNLLKTNYLGVSTYQKRDQVITIGTG